MVDGDGRRIRHVQLLDAREVAGLLRISIPTLWRCVKQERVPMPIHMGPRLVRWRLVDLERFVGVKAGAVDAERETVTTGK
jgi:predicted DNA-binding transcriptional regulator AlpA